MRKINLNKEKFLLVGALFLFALMVVSVSATVTLDLPASGDRLNNDSVFWNASGSDDFINFTKCLIWISSPSTANSTALNISQNVNHSIDATYINSTTLVPAAAYIDIIALEDASDYTMLASCTNSSAGVFREENSSGTTVTINIGGPTTPSSLSPSAGSSDDDGLVNFSATVVGENTTACTLYFPFRNPGSASYTMTHSGDSCFYTGFTALLVPEETYPYIIGAFDGLNESNTSLTTFDVSVDTPANWLFQEQKDIGVEGDTLTVGSSGKIGGIPIWLILLITVGVIAVIVARKK